MFFNILYIYSKTGTTDYELLLQIQLTKEDQLFRWLTFFYCICGKNSTISTTYLTSWSTCWSSNNWLCSSSCTKTKTRCLWTYSFLHPTFSRRYFFFCTNSYNFCLYWNYLYLSNSKTSNWSKKNYCIFIGRSYKCSSTWNYNRNKRKSTRSYFSKTKSWSRFWFSFFFVLVFFIHDIVFALLNIIVDLFIFIHYLLEFFYFSL